MTSLTRSRSRAIGAAMFGGLLVAGVVGSPTSAHGPDPLISSSEWEQDQVLEFRWRSGSEPPAAIKTAIRDAADDANATRASQAATFDYDVGGSSPIGYGAGATCGTNGLACFTRTVPGGFTMWLREQGHDFDWGTLKWCQMYADPPNGCYDAETIALDEFGHIEILDHHRNYDNDSDYLDAVVQTLSHSKPKVGWNMHVLGRCDVATLQREYDVTNTSTKISTCLDLDTTVTLAASPISVAYNGSVTFTATLKINGDDSYVRLRGNPVSNRTVKLQRRPPGGSTWTTLGTMPAGGAAGTYVLAVRLTSATEFRATFATPSTEGLNGDNSSTVLVTVGPCKSPCPQSVER